MEKKSDVCLVPKGGGELCNFWSLLMKGQEVGSIQRQAWNRFVVFMTGNEERLPGSPFSSLDLAQAAILEAYAKASGLTAVL